MGSRIEPIKQEVSDTGGLDIVWGAQAIGAEIGVGARRAFYLLERRLVPGRKIGATWCASREALRRHFAMNEVA